MGKVNRMNLRWSLFARRLRTEQATQHTREKGTQRARRDGITLRRTKRSDTNTIDTKPSECGTFLVTLSGICRMRETQ